MAESYHTEYKLTYHAGSGRWVKFYRGKLRYILKGPKDDPTYEEARAKWEGRIKPGIDAEAIGATPTGPAPVLVRPAAAALPAPLVTLKTVEQAKDLFIADKQAERATGQLGPSRLSVLNLFLGDLVGFMSSKGVLTVAQITEDVVAAYRVQVLTADHAFLTKKEKLAVAKTFLSFCWKRRWLDQLPRNLDDLKLKDNGNGRSKAVPTFTVEQCQTLFGRASLRTKAFILLGLNCGYTQVDISKLDNSVIDWQAAIIDNRRSKTGNRQRHKLWSVTRQVLQACIEKGKAHTSGLVFRDEDGRGSLIKEGMEGTHLKKHDCIKAAFERLMTKVGVTGSFKLFRKTGATVLETQVLGPDQKYVTSVYLAHAEKGMKRFYTPRDYDILDSALEKMEAVFGLKYEPAKKGEPEPLAQA